MPTKVPQSDEELLEKIGQEDEQSFDELYQRYSKSIYRLSYHYTGNSADADELTQQVFVKLWYNARKFKGKSSVKTWIFRIAVNIAMDYFRRNKSRDRFQTYSYANLPEEIETKGKRNLEIIALKQALRKLSSRERMAILLVSAEAQSYKETAGIMGCSVRAVEGLVRRAKLKLREIMSK